MSALVRTFRFLILRSKVAEAVGYEGAFEYDVTRPDGMPRKLLDVSKLAALGWKAKIELGRGLRSTYSDFLAHAPRI